ncbi:MAG: ABC transporter transmembrane domain-containing protein [Saprospiraceae bacterium]|nr:ABC transporter transmembrane domain-containing protein [Saprospiraceae bacterium]
MEMEEETRRTPSRESIREALSIFAFVRPYRVQFIAGLFLLFLSSTVFMVFPYIIGVMMDVAQGRSPLPDLDLPSIALLLLAVLIFQGMVSYLRVMMFARVSEGSTADIRSAVYEKLISLPMVFFEKNRVGELVSRITNDIEKIYNAFYFVLAEFIRQIILLVGGVLFLAIQTPRLAVVMLAVIPIIVVGAMLFGRRIRKLSKERQQILGETNTILDETLQSIHAVKAFTNEFFELGRYRNANDRVVGMSMRYAVGRAIFAVFIITVLFGALFFVIWMGMRMVQTGDITAGQLISFVTFTAVVAGAIAGLGNFYTELVGAIGATERVREILKTPGEPELRNGPGVKAGQLRGAVVFSDVHFSYPTRADLPVLKGIDLHIAPGQKVALVGQSGAGKSTIMALLLQFHQPRQGHITVDGRDIADYDLYDYRRNFAIVPQEVILFGGSIRENILYGNPEASEAQIIEAARKANAWEFISSFPEGLNTVVGERGIKLSGGQRQRIAIARAILRDPAILLLDEATSSLDAESEKTVQEALYNLMEGRTSIVIAHRLATIRHVDCIYVLEEGRIAEMGTHEELSRNTEGLYGHLARLQLSNAE